MFFKSLTTCHNYITVTQWGSLILKHCVVMTSCHNSSIQLFSQTFKKASIKRRKIKALGELEGDHHLEALILCG